MFEVFKSQIFTGIFFSVKYLVVFVVVEHCTYMFYIQ